MAASIVWVIPAIPTSGAYQTLGILLDSPCLRKLLVWLCHTRGNLNLGSHWADVLKTRRSVWSKKNMQQLNYLITSSAYFIHVYLYSLYLCIVYISCVYIYTYCACVSVCVCEWANHSRSVNVTGFSAIPRVLLDRWWRQPLTVMACQGHSCYAIAQPTVLVGCASRACMCSLRFLRWGVLWHRIVNINIINTRNSPFWHAFRSSNTFHILSPSFTMFPSFAMASNVW